MLAANGGTILIPGMVLWSCLFALQNYMFGLKKNIKTKKLKNNSPVVYKNNVEPIEKSFEVLLRRISQNQTIPDAELKTYAYTCINKKAEIVSTAGVYLYKRLGETDEEVFEHPFIDLTRGKNFYNQTFKHILHFVSSNADLKGNCYVRILRDNAGKPLMFMPLITKGVRVVINQSLGIVSHYEYSYNGTVSRYEYKDVLHFKIPNPDDLIFGKPTIDTLKNVIDIDYLQTQYLKNYYTHDATPHTVLETDSDLQKDYIEELENKWIDKFAGIFKKFKPIILKNGLKMSKLQSTPKETSAVESQKFTLDRILAGFTMPKPIMAVTDQVNYANASAGLKSFLDHTIYPFVSLVIESVFTNFVQAEYDNKLFVKFDYAFIYDKETQLKVLDTLAKYEAVTINEIRASENYGQIDDERANTIFKEDEENKNNKQNDNNE